MKTRIAVSQAFATELERSLTIPHTLGIVTNQSDAEMATLLSATDVFVSGAFKAAWRDPKECALRLIHSPGAGTDGIDFGAVPPGCTVCNVYGHERGVAEHAFLLMVALQRNLFGMDAALRKGDWTPQVRYVPELRGRNLLILGLGHIGQELVRWGRFLDMNVTVLTRNPGKDRPARARAIDSGHGLPPAGSLKDIREHLKQADFVVVAIPAATGTIDLIGDEELRAMKPGAFIINVGRGAVINEEALYRALQARTIAGAGLDVWYQYPAGNEKKLPSTMPFHELSNVIMTPHKPTVETMDYRWKEIGENIARFVRGEPLNCVVAVA
jgi:phosphoglycerate dehydrogenase-like enzyme